MKLRDQAQNTGARIATIHIVAFILLTLLGVRLYDLQIVKGDYYEQRAENQRIRLISIPAPRGAIFDRNGTILVDSRPTFNVVISNEPMRKMDPEDDRIFEYAAGLNLEPQVISDRLKQLKGQNDFETLVLKDNASMQDIAWVEGHSLEYPELRIELQPQRFYPHGTAMAHFLGYVGEVSPKQLETERWSSMRPGDIVGKGGLEEYYDEFLRGRPGYRKVIVDSRGRIQSEIEVVPPQAGQDLISTIDLEVQMAAEAQLAASVTKRGTIIAMDPNNGEMLALASLPSFDPNVFVQGSKTREGRKQISEYWQDPERPLYNRATQGRYPPGSTWKIPMSVGGLQTGAISVQNSSLACGGGIMLGNKFTRCMGSHGSPTLGPAISRSCNGYYYRLALKMKIEGLIEMIETLEFDRQTGIDIPNERVSQTPKSWKPIVEKREGRWSDIRTIYAGIGQDTVVVTPISLLRSFAAVAAHGNMYVPHFLKEFRPISATPHFGARPGFGFQRPEPKVIKLSPDEEELIVGGLWAAVNGGGTARGSQIPGFDVGGKTGTAQVSPTGSPIKDHAWFVSFAPAYKPEIAVLALIENVGFGGSHAAPAAKGVYEAYIAARRPNTPQPDEMARR
ncbi:MAG TPA: penicillin-binding protein 2 [Pyrinomonadaceae bacterium]|nr:penicillin-binding protein 2 [Pyrinomonadaceae bacterium]HMP65348.1 penicillin-binding protein 2 [Pyrinomonadaceae bacterium]